MLHHIREGQTLHFKDLQQLVARAGFKVWRCHQHIPRTGNANASLERSLNDSTEDDLEVPRTLEQRSVLAVFHEYFECREIKPRLRKLGELLQLTRYSGPENEYCIERKVLLSFQQLLDTVQCSRAQFEDGLRNFRALEFDGHIRVLEYEYGYRIISLMLGLISENSWALDEVERGETISALKSIAPEPVVTGLFDIYTIPSERCPGQFSYQESLVARIVAQNILQPGLRFRNEEFMHSWQEARGHEGSVQDETQMDPGGDGTVY
ncbi:sister chromatid cohesion protein DCC1-like [Drosophila miranda]|uniref:sister chromatid cohesion protein DCC1-like n=1 Tax=Drosophila miranda TaxID=7229 RepID=UPI00143F3319|nr:sister chromatid cohesion protein DCC1-like [Drosophila miranda]